MSKLNKVMSGLLENELNNKEAHLKTYKNRKQSFLDEVKSVEGMIQKLEGEVLDIKEAIRESIGETK